MERTETFCEPGDRRGRRLLLLLLPFLCAGTLPCRGDTVRILAITPQLARAPGDVITFGAEADDPAGPPGLLVWESDRDGVLGVTSQVVFARDASGLSLGGHRITLLLEDGAGIRTHCGSAALLVVAAPIIRLGALPVGAGTVRFAPDEEDARLELHRIEIRSDLLGEVRIQGITYRPSPGTRLRGIKSPRLMLDRNADGRAQDEEEVAQGVNDAEKIRFSNLDLAVRTGAGGLFLVARVTRRALHGASLSPGPLVVLTLAAALLTLVRRRTRWRGLELGVFLVLFAASIWESGCRKQDDSVTIQLTLKDPGDFEATAVDSGLRVEIEAFPPEGISGPRIRVKRKYVSESGL